MLDGQIAIVSNHETRLLVGYDTAHFGTPLWRIVAGAPGSGPWALAVADGELYVGEKPDSNPHDPATDAAHDVVRYRLYGRSQPVVSGRISGETFDFTPQEIAISGKDTLLIEDPASRDVAVVASAEHRPRPLRSVDATTTLVDEDLIAVAPGGRIFASNADSSLHEYPRNAGMESPPIRRIDGRHESDSTFDAIAASDDGLVFRTDSTDDSIVITSATHSTLHSDVTSIAGPRTQLKKPQGLTLDGRGDLFVANEGGDDVLVFAARSRGDVSPTMILGGRFSGLSHPTSVGDAADRTILVVVSPPSPFFPSAEPTAEILRFLPSGVRLASGNFARSCHFTSL